MTYHKMHESFGILSDWCGSVEELLTISDSGITAKIDLTEMHETDLNRLVELGWKLCVDYSAIHLYV